MYRGQSPPATRGNFTHNGDSPRQMSRSPSMNRSRQERGFARRSEHMYMNNRSEGPGHSNQRFNMPNHRGRSRSRSSSPNRQYSGRQFNNSPHFNNQRRFRSRSPQNFAPPGRARSPYSNQRPVYNQRFSRNVPSDRNNQDRQYNRRRSPPPQRNASFSSTYSNEMNGMRPFQRQRVYGDYRSYPRSRSPPHGARGGQFPPQNDYDRSPRRQRSRPPDDYQGYGRQNYQNRGLRREESPRMMRSRSPRRQQPGYDPRGRFKSRSPGPRQGESPNRGPIRQRAHMNRDSMDRNGHPRANPCRFLGFFGLHADTSEEELRKVIETYTTPKSIKLVVDVKTGMSRRYAFGEFATTKDADIVREALNGAVLQGRTIRVDFSITRGPHSPTPGHYLGRDASPGRQKKEGHEFEGNDRSESRGRSFSPKNKYRQNEQPRGNMNSAARASQEVRSPNFETKPVDPNYVCPLTGLTPFQPAEKTEPES